MTPAVPPRSRERLEPAQRAPSIAGYLPAQKSTLYHSGPHQFDGPLAGGAFSEARAISYIPAHSGLAWERDLDRNGVPGLRSTRYQIYRDTDIRKS